MKVLVAGAGAVGSWIGGELAAAGARVRLLARGAHARAMAERGLRIEPEDRPAFELHPDLAVDLERAMAAGPFDLILVCVKSYATEDLASDLARLEAAADGSTSMATVLSLQNGVGNEALLARHLGASRIASGSLTKACQILEPGRLWVGAKGGLALSGTAPPVAELGRLLAGRGISLRRVADAEALKWSKLLLNMLGAATCAILAWPPARVFEHRALFAIDVAAWREAIAVVDGLGHSPVGLPGYPVPLYAWLARRLPEAWLYRLMAPRLARGRGERLPGPAADLAAGRPETEIPWLNGAVWRAARELGQEAPVNRSLDRLVSDLASGRRQRSDFAGRPDRLLAHLAEGEGSLPRSGDSSAR